MITYEISADPTAFTAVKNTLPWLVPIIEAYGGAKVFGVQTLYLECADEKLLTTRISLCEVVFDKDGNELSRVITCPSGTLWEALMEMGDERACMAKYALQVQKWSSPRQGSHYSFSLYSTPEGFNSLWDYAKLIGEKNGWDKANDIAIKVRKLKDFLGA